MKNKGLRFNEGKNGMKHYHYDLGNIDGVACVGEERIVLEKGHFEMCASFDRDGLKVWNESGVQIQFKVWDMKDNNSVKKQTRNQSKYNSIEMDFNVACEEDIDLIINGLVKLKELIFGTNQPK